MREALDFDESAAFAREMGLTPTRWNNFENGNRLTRDIAELLVRKIPGLTVDWLFFGKPDALSGEMLRLLGELPTPSRASDRPSRSKAR